MSTRLSDRVERNRAHMRSAVFRRQFLLLIPMFYVIFVIGRLLEGVGFPDALWDLGGFWWTFGTWSVCTIAIVIAHRWRFGRD